MEAIANGSQLPGTIPTPGRAKKAYLAQLRVLLRRLLRTTNYHLGKEDFENDIRQIVMWKNGLIDSWPLHILGWKPQTMHSLNTL